MPGHVRAEPACHAPSRRRLPLAIADTSFYSQNMRSTRHGGRYPANVPSPRVGWTRLLPIRCVYTRAMPTLGITVSVVPPIRFEDVTSSPTTTSVGFETICSSLWLVEPLRTLFNDEVRAVGAGLRLPESLVVATISRSGLAVRIIGEVAAERLSV